MKITNIDWDPDHDELEKLPKQVEIKWDSKNLLFFAHTRYPYHAVAVLFNPENLQIIIGNDCISSILHQDYYTSRTPIV